MKSLIYLPTSFFFISACGQTKPKPTKDTTIQTPVTSDSNRLIFNSKKIANLDSIDRINNESVMASGNDITRAFVFLKDGDSSISLTANIRKDHRVFGYAKPDIKSERLLLLSVFTNDVEHNPFGCRLGSYYDTGGMEDIKLKYLGKVDGFIKAVAIEKSNNKTILYFEKKWIEFE